MIIQTRDRTLDDGTWTPVVVEVSGTNVTISGYTATEFTGFISISGVISGMVIDCDAMTVTMDGENAENRMLYKNYELMVGTGETFFEVSGASDIRISYTNRWL